MCYRRLINSVSQEKEMTGLPYVMIYTVKSNFLRWITSRTESLNKIREPDCMPFGHSIFRLAVWGVKNEKQRAYK